MKKMTVLCFVISVALLAGSAIADVTYTCTNGTQERIISVMYQDQVAQVPCEVQYQKEGVTETLWSAQNEIGYCDMKATAFIEKQRGWGWNCEVSGAAMAEEEVAQEATMQESMHEGMKQENN